MLWLTLAVEAYHYELPDSARQRFEAALRAELRKKVRSEAAGGLAALLRSYLESEIEYPGREEHVHRSLIICGNQRERSIERRIWIRFAHSFMISTTSRRCSRSWRDEG